MEVEQGRGVEVPLGWESDLHARLLDAVAAETTGVLNRL